jgi:molybdopterin/thiamine biosynthesis adenylyltransferase
LGSNLTAQLCRQGFKKLTVVDRDRVDERNIGTQVYSIDDIGALKAETLRNLIYRDVGEEVQAIAKEVNDKTVSKYLSDCDLLVDAFDNSISRRLLSEFSASKQVPCLHIGVNGGYGELRWNDSYIVPSDAGDDVCDYPLARNLVLLVTAVASEVLIRFIVEGVMENYSITLGDLSVNLEE